MRIGGIYAEIRARVSRLRGDLNKAEGMVRGSSKNMQTSISSIGFVAAGVAATAFGAIVAATAASGVKSYAELERKILRTESIIKATGNAAQLSSKQLVDLANRLDLATLNDRDAILDAINAMQTFRSVSGDTFERSIELSVDLAEVLGTDLRSQVVQLGKALEDPITGLTALRRVGVSFTEQQKEQIKTLVESNRAIEAQGVILDEISKQVGGAAAGAAGGLAGKVDTLNYRWRELKETMGSSAPVFNTANKGLDAIAKTLETINKLLKNENFKMLFMPRDINEWTAAMLAGSKGSTPYVGKINKDTPGYEKYIGGGPGGAPPPAGVAGWTADDQEALDKYGVDAATAYDDAFLDGMAATNEAYSNLLGERLQNLMDHNALEFQAYSEQADNIISIQEYRSQKETEAAQNAVSNVGKALQLMGRNNKAAFEAYKIYETGKAVITGIAAALHAYKWGQEFGGPALGAAYAAASLAYTGGQVAAIQNAKFTGGSASPGAVGTYAADSTTGVPTFENEKRGTLTFHIYGDISDPESFVDAFVEKINDAADRDVFVNYARGVRAA